MHMANEKSPVFCSGIRLPTEARDEPVKSTAVSIRLTEETEEHDIELGASAAK